MAKMKIVKPEVSAKIIGGKGPGTALDHGLAGKTNFGAQVNAQLKAGLRGQALAAWIQANHP